MYETAQVKRADVLVTVTATGTLQAVTTVEVGAEVTGRLLSVKVDANDVVKKGQLLAEIHRSSSAAPPRISRPPRSRRRRRRSCRRRRR